MTDQLSVVLMAMAIGAAFAVGALLLLILTVAPGTRPAARHLWPILASEAVILAAGVMPWMLPAPALLALLLIAAARIGYESGVVHGVAEGRQFAVSHAVLLVAVAALAWASPAKPFLWTATFALAAALAVLWGSSSGTARSLARFAIFPLLPFAAFSQAASDPRLAPLLVLAFFLVEIFDSFSLLGGRLYGRTPLVPRLSPRKTWEGLATGAGALAVALLSLSIWLGFTLLPTLAAAVVVVIAAMAGDLLGSTAKRRAGVKDYPAVMTVQGGLLDIADSWLLAGPAVALLFSALGWT